MASYTEHLNLLKKDPVADGADTFNIETMLNENWNKIDAAKGVLDAALTEKLDADMVGVPGGAASLDGAGKVPEAQLPAMNFDPSGSAAAVQKNLTGHLNNKSNPHGVTPAQIGAAPTSHAHSAGDINSGVLSPARGGTGVSSIDALVSSIFPQGAPHIVTGTYVGAGYAGEAHKNSLTFDFVPKFLFVKRNGRVLSALGSGFIWVYNSAGALTFYMNNNNSVDDSWALYTTLSGNTIYWWSQYVNNDSSQCNGYGVTYEYIAIG